MWDARSGLVVRSYKDCASPPRGIALIDAAHFVAAQVGRPQLNIYSWAREQPVFRCQTPEELRALVCTSDGTYCVGGGLSGRLYLWAVRSGALLLAWDGHFKSVTALALTADDARLVAGGADALVTVWSLAEALACSEASGARGAAPVPAYTWSAHALPVSAVLTGATWPHGLALSASLDCEVHVREMARGELLYVLRAPAAVHSLALSPCEHTLYAGTAAGLVHEATLVVSAADAAEPQAAGGGGGDALARGVPFGTHRACVHGVLVLAAGGQLATCGADGSVRTWDVRTKQQLAHLSSHAAQGAFETLLAVAWPPPGAREAATQLPVLPFKKYMDVAAAAPPASLASAAELSAFLGCVLVRPLLKGAMPGVGALGASAGDEGPAAAGGRLSDEPMAGAAAEIAEALRESTQQWQIVANDLYRVAVADIVAEIAGSGGGHAV